MGFENIEKWSANYHHLKKWVQFWHNDIFYRSVTVLHQENIPGKGHLIFTPNHQNALMDALALLFTVNRRMVFMARSDIFKKKFIAAILYFLRILPIYRIRDGYDSLKKNKASFQKTVDVLTSEECALVILPEGNHAGIRRLRPLKKGFARIAFQAEEATGYTLNMQIVPVGIDYSDYQNFRSKLTVNFGRPIAVSKYYKQYKENPAVAINVIKEELSKEIKKLIIHIETEEYYELFNKLRKLYLKRFSDRLEKDLTDENSLPFQRSIVNQLNKVLKSSPDTIDQLDKKVHVYLKKLKQIKLEDEYVIYKFSRKDLLLPVFFLLITSPLYVYGALNNIIPTAISVWSKNKIKDPQFKSSFLYVVSLLAFPLFYILQSLVLIFWISKWYWIFIYFFSLPVSAVFVLFYIKIWRKFRKSLSICSLFRKKKAFMEQLQKEYGNILNFMDKIIQPVVEE
jgi:1-acyl-sn-glycerol-3-phosphate acyltransferase/uncharacterized coiled-coil protein SlyX